MATMRANDTLDVVAVRATLDREGVVYIEPESEFFSEEEWTLLEQHAQHEKFRYELVSVGDAGEPSLVEVGRLMTDVERPKVVNGDITEGMLAVLCSNDRMMFYANLLETSMLHLRRAQINKMHAGSFIGEHIDQDSNPDYQIAVVLQMGSKFTGGEFVVNRPAGEKVVVQPRYRSVTISRCDFPHEVLTVTSGVRTSLVYFVAPHAGDNRRAKAA